MSDAVEQTHVERLKAAAWEARMRNAEGVITPDCDLGEVLPGVTIVVATNDRGARFAALKASNGIRTSWLRL